MRRCWTDGEFDMAAFNKLYTREFGASASVSRTANGKRIIEGDNRSKAEAAKTAEARIAKSLKDLHDKRDG